MNIKDLCQRSISKKLWRSASTNKDQILVCPIYYTDKGKILIDLRYQEHEPTSVWGW